MTGMGSSIPAGSFLVAAAAILAILATQTTSVNEQISWGSIGLTALFIGLAYVMSAITGYGALGLVSWRLGPWLLVYGSVTFGLTTLSWTGPQTGVSAQILPGSVVRTLGLTAVGVILLTAGYCVGPYRLTSHYMRRAKDAVCYQLTDEIRSATVPWVLFTVGLAAQVAFALLNGHFGYVGDTSGVYTRASGYSQYFALASNCVPLAVAAAAIRVYQAPTAGARVTLTILFAGAIATGALAGNKVPYIVTILAVIIPFTMARQRLPVKTMATAFLFFLLIIIPFNQAYRAASLGTAARSTGQAIATAPSILGRVLVSDASPALGQSAAYLADRIRSIDSPAIIMQRTPSQIPYADPVQLLTAPVADFIPRILWPGKPILLSGAQMSQEYFQIQGTSSAITPEGDLYRHGGWLPLIAGMFLFGCGLRVLDEVIDLRRSVHGGFLIILLFPSVVMGETDWATLLAGIPGCVLLWLIVVTASFRRRRMTTVVRSGSNPARVSQ